MKPNCTRLTIQGIVHCSVVVRCSSFSRWKFNLTVTPENSQVISKLICALNHRPGISQGTQTDNLIYKSIIIITLHTYKRKENSSGNNGLAMTSAPLPQAAQLGYKPNVFSLWILFLQLRLINYCKVSI